MSRSQPDPTSHPCMTCGACCAAFRVSFHWSETRADSHYVPEELTLSISQHLSAMQGTNQSDPRCIALMGELGKNATCAIYKRRPTCCRAFEASFENGKRNSRCDEARSKHGMKPLTPETWQHSSLGSLDSFDRSMD